MSEKRVLTKKQRQAVILMAEGEISQKEIAARLGVTEQTITNWKKKEPFVTEYNNLIKKNINFAAGKAFKRELELLKEADNDSVSLSAAKDILDRAGFKPEVIVNKEIEIGNDSKSFIEALNQSAFDIWNDDEKNPV